MFDWDDLGRRWDSFLDEDEVAAASGVEEEAGQSGSECSSYTYTSYSEPEPTEELVSQHSPRASSKKPAPPPLDECGHRGGGSSAGLQAAVGGGRAAELPHRNVGICRHRW